MQRNKQQLLELFPLPLDLEPISSKVLQPAKFKIDYENLVDFDQNQMVSTYILIIITSASYGPGLENKSQLGGGIHVF